MRLPRRTMVVASCLLTAGAILGGAVPASGAGPATKRTVIAVRGIDRLGQVSPLGDAIAVPLGTGAARREYVADSQGVLHLTPGRYLVGGDISTGASRSKLASITLAAKTVRVAGQSETITLDARGGTPVRVALDVPGATENSLRVGLCSAGGHTASAPSVLVAGASADNGEMVYVKPFPSSSARLGVASMWTGPDGSRYLLGRIKRAVSADARFSFRASAQGTLVLKVAAGTSQGSKGFLSVDPQPDCVPSSGADDEVPVSVPGQSTFHLTPGRYLTNFAADDLNDDTTSLIQRVVAGHQYTRTFGLAVRGPGSGVLPVYDSSLPTGDNLYVQLLTIFQDPAAIGAECCARGTVAVRMHGRVVKKAGINSQQPFEANLRTPGWYTIDLSATRRPPHHGVTPAVLSSRVHLTWRFKASQQELDTTAIHVPASVTVFRPRMLDSRNEAKPRAVTPLSLTIFLGRKDHRHSVKSVKLQVSYDGHSWHTVPVSGKGTSWLASVTDPAAGFVDLRSTVTDVRGNRTVETIYRAYGIS